MDFSLREDVHGGRGGWKGGNKNAGRGGLCSERGLRRQVSAGRRFSYRLDGAEKVLVILIFYDFWVLRVWLRYDSFWLCFLVLLLLHSFCHERRYQQERCATETEWRWTKRVKKLLPPLAALLTLGMLPKSFPRLSYQMTIMLSQDIGKNGVIKM